jgi:hypothetical protein
MRAALLRIAPFALLAVTACGGSDNGFNGATINITSSGLSPSQAVTVPSAGQVRFVNQDTVNHQVQSANCSELNSPSLAPTQSFTATLGQGAKACPFVDALNPSSTQYQSSIQVSAPGTGGGGGGPGY